MLLLTDQCPEGAFKHPYKARCYLVFNSKKSYYEARQHCRLATNRTAYYLITDNDIILIYNLLQFFADIYSIHTSYMYVYCIGIDIVLLYVCRRGFYGELAIIPNRMEHRALWDKIYQKYESLG